MVADVPSETIDSVDHSVRDVSAFGLDGAIVEERLELRSVSGLRGLTLLAKDSIDFQTLPGTEVSASRLLGIE